jgi:hypothetical protein
MIGERVSHYRILEHLGSGGMGRVYAAEDVVLGRRVALKFLGGDAPEGGPSFERFLREARAASSLNHPNICTIYEVGEHDGRPFLAMEVVDGTTLRECLAGRPLPWPELCDLGVQIADALEAAHAAGIVHRDIKPANIMVTRRGQAKVMDFGLAKLLTPSGPGEAEGPATLTTDGAAIGTIAYMSPEQARGEEVDARSDLFSLGLVLYEMATGRSAFGGGTTAVTFDAILNRAPAPLRERNPAAPDALQRIIDRALAKDRRERYQTAADLCADLRALQRQLASVSLTAAATEVVDETVVDVMRVKERAERQTSGLGRPRRWLRARTAVAVLAASLAGATLLVWRLGNPTSTAVLTDKDTILLAEFDNRTDEGVFDETLRQGLAARLQESPFLDLFPEARVRQALPLMGRSPDDRLTRAVAAELCQRQGLKAFITGSIARFDRHYSITLEAFNSQTGESLALIQREAEGKDQVLTALSRAASDLRRELGESLSSIQKFEAPLEATTTSLEALKAYSLAVQQVAKGRLREAIVLFQRAVELDPAFASAYQQLAVQSLNTNQPRLAAEYSQQAFARRDRASELERLRIANFYYSFVTGELEGAIDAQRAYKEAYPRDHRGPGNLSHLYLRTGRFELAAKEADEALQRYSSGFPWYANLAEAFIRLGRFGDARGVYDRAMQAALDSEAFRAGLYQIAFADGDTARMEEQIRWANDERREHVAADWRAQSFAFQGQWGRSEDSARRAIDLARRADLTEAAATYAAGHALRAALLERCAVTRASAAQAIALERTSVSLTRAALALALCDGPSRAEALAEELAQRFPKDTLVTSIWLPAVSAVLAIRRRAPADALQQLQSAARYEPAAEFLPQYLRATAYLHAARPAEAAAEFQRILDHRGHAPLSVVYPLAALGLARAATLTADRARSQRAYAEVLTWWSDADPNLAPAVAARREAETADRPE